MMPLSTLLPATEPRRAAVPPVRLRARWPGVVAALTSLLVAACASPGDSRPQARALSPDTLSARATLADAPVSPAGWPAADWWRSLDDPQLDALIAEALADNPGLEVASARIRQADAQAGLAHAGLAPTLGGRLGVSGVRLPSNIVGPELGGSFNTSQAATLSLSLPFDLWGGRRAAWIATLGEQRAAEVELQAARISLSTQVARAYVRLAYAGRSEAIARDDLQRARDLLRLTQQRVRSGLDSQAQLRQAEAAEADVDRAHQQAALDVAAARIALAVLLGKGPDRGLALSVPARLDPARFVLPDDLPANLLGRRPDIVAARWRAEAEAARVSAARADFYPNFNLSAIVGFASPQLRELVDPGSRFAYIAPALSLPILDGGRLRALHAGRQADQDLAVAQYNQVLVQAINEVADQTVTLRGLAGQIATQQRAVTAATQALDLATLRYRRGVGSHLEALTVQQSMFEAERRLVELQQRQVDASIRLIAALGGGYVDEAPPAASTPLFPSATPTAPLPAAADITTKTAR